MRRVLLTTAIAFALIGCRDQVGDASQTTTTAPATLGIEVSAAAPNQPSASAPADPGESCLGRATCGDLPLGVTIPIAHTLRSGQIYTSAYGKRRQIVFEILDGDASAVHNAFSKSMQDAGFTSGDVQKRENGVQTIRFEKDGYGAVNTWAKPSVDLKPANPNAKAILGVDLPEAQ